MTNLRTDEMAFFDSFTKICTDENKAIYSILKAGLFPYKAIFGIKFLNTCNMKSYVKTLYI